jgi:hypothetical protein
MGKPNGRMELLGKSDMEGKAAMGSGERTEPWERARWTVKSVRVTDKSRGSERISAVSLS